MATSATNGLIRHIRTAFLPDGTALTDSRLVRRFVEHNDQAAFAALVRRHGPMVWGVCRRILASHHDAEDAFQATFIVLARKAAAIRPPEMLVNWLYGVAHKTALKARSLAARRAARELAMSKEIPEPLDCKQDIWSDLRPLLDQELSRLPDKYRAPLLLCDLEGKTRHEAARQLGWPEGTVAGRLARARSLLAKRLTRRGLTLSAVALTNALVHNAASAAVPPSVLAVATKVAVLNAAGQALHATGLSWQAARLAQNMIWGVAVRRLLVVGVFLLVGFGGGGVAWLAIGPGKSAAVLAQPREGAGSGAQPSVAKRMASPDAQALLDRAVESVPLVKDLEQRVWILCSIAPLQAQAGLREAAKETIEKARKAAVEAENEQRMGEVAECQAEIGDINGALQTAIILDCRDCIFDHIAAIQAKAGDYRGALRMAKLVQDEPYKGGALAMIAQAQAKARQFQAALQTTGKIVYPPERAGALVAIAAEEIRSGDRAAGNQALEESLQQAERASEFFGKPERPSDHKPAVLAEIAGIKALAGADEDAAKIARGLRQPWQDVAWTNIAMEQAARGLHDDALRSSEHIGDSSQRGEAEKTSWRR
jgi:RNA polymerase sigma factor (sigma-70 family)